MHTNIYAVHSHCCIAKVNYLHAGRIAWHKWDSTNMVFDYNSSRVVHTNTSWKGLLVFDMSS